MPLGNRIDDDNRYEGESSSRRRRVGVDTPDPNDNAMCVSAQCAVDDDSPKTPEPPHYHPHDENTPPRLKRHYQSEEASAAQAPPSPLRHRLPDTKLWGLRAAAPASALARMQAALQPVVPIREDSHDEVKEFTAEPPTKARPSVSLDAMDGLLEGVSSVIISRPKATRPSSCPPGTFAAGSLATLAGSQWQRPASARTPSKLRESKTVDTEQHPTTFLPSLPPSP